MTNETYAALVLSLPSRDKTVRMRIWRALLALGCGVLRDGVYLLPKDVPQAATLGELEGQVKEAGGFAMTVELTGEASKLRKLFDRTDDYAALIGKITAAKSGPSVKRLRRALEELGKLDFYPGEAARQAREALSGLEEKLIAGEPRSARSRVKQLDPRKYQRRVWATRKAPWVDRLASAWLIKRFIDREARFAWIERPRQRPRAAVGFDFDGADFTHVGNWVTFEVLLASFGLDHDPALAALGAAVHFLDVGGVPVPDAKGLETLLRGIKQKARSDDALLAEAMRIFDHFYSAYATSSRS